MVYGGADALVLQSEIPLVQTELCGCGATATLQAGDQAFLALTYQLPHQIEVYRLSREEVVARIDRTVGFWQADPVVAIAIALLLFREGRETLREGTLCSC